MQQRSFIALGIIALLGVSLLHLFIGSTPISMKDYYHALFAYDQQQTIHIVARDLRIPRYIMALIAGAGLSISGMLMQTLFRNPLAEPNILGVTTGSSLFVAITLLTGFTFFQSELGIIASALIGAFLFGILILSFAKYLKNKNSLLLIGIMLGSFSASFISILQSYSDVNQLKSFTMWTMGSLQQLSFQQIPFLMAIFFTASVLSLFLIKPLNALVLGENNAQSLGINTSKARFMTILAATSITGLITAFCGPIAFIGMAVPNLVKLILKTQNHLALLLGNLIYGAIFLLFCDSLIQASSTILLIPLNAVTSLIGAPFVIYIIIKKWS